MAICYFCENPEKHRESILGYYCEDCKKLQRILKIYSEDLYEVCDKVFIRNKKQQDFKIKNLETTPKTTIKTRSQTKEIKEEVD